MYYPSTNHLAVKENETQNTIKIVKSKKKKKKSNIISLRKKRKCNK